MNSNHWNFLKLKGYDFFSSSYFSFYSYQIVTIFNCTTLIPKCIQVWKKTQKCEHKTRFAEEEDSDSIRRINSLPIVWRIECLFYVVCFFAVVVAAGAAAVVTAVAATRIYCIWSFLQSKKKNTRSSVNSRNASVQLQWNTKRCFSKSVAFLYVSFHHSVRIHVRAHQYDYRYVQFLRWYNVISSTTIT